MRFLVTSDTRKKSGAVKPYMLATMRAEPAAIRGNRFSLPVDFHSQRPDNSLGEDRKQTVSFRRLTPFQIRHRNSGLEYLASRGDRTLQLFQTTFDLVLLFCCHD